ncbi:T9SS C-terminal target domain-containing protein [Kaistella jeonii]|uniref:Gliding motility-associated C-terminal domain-containing protein n=1 Tax=Kaistella jeonii TaxID=266749 RepID=A0A0C1FP67_9FLAO|nr:T9SS C-terminal target domain-containing protein [Kaistella jeonii]KIA89659.1 hypothetical protein OA86_03255 [Kaistella jeonii]SFB89012.1 gliding motility-associated C-terminal domain-containing protein [Kaistella jeonii]VEI95878.1 gliding motility-associated C-terminal domain [Kaistella jeonii]
MKFIRIFTFFISVICTLSITMLNAQYISVNTTYTADQLVKDIFFGSQNANCISVDNVTVTGFDFGFGNKSFGYFNKNGSNFEMSDGIILSTGSALTAVGPNSYIQTADRNSPFANSSWAGDQDLVDVLAQSNLNYDDILNATTLEFDFTALKSNKISFEYMFLSEEYREGNCKYSDAFAFLIKKANNTDPYLNIAVVPGTTIPVSTLTINASAGCPQNTGYFGSYNDVKTPTNFNGQTKILSAKADVEIGVKYHIKLVIADHGDTTGLFDSAVFLKAGSFLGNKDLGSDRLISTGSALCENSTLQLNATTSGATYQWYKDGVLIAGATSGTYTVATSGDYEVMIDDSGCQQKGSIKIEFAEKPVVIEKTFCNYNEGNSISVKLQDLNTLIVSNLKDYFKVKYFQDSACLIPLSDNFSYTSDVDIYAEVESGNCAKVKQVVHLYTPKKSLILDDQKICQNATAKLEAEVGFKNYKWMRENGDIIAQGALINFVDNIPVGKYSVELTSMNGCSLIQKVEVIAAELPQIINIDVTGNTATVFVTGGKPPYQYALDNGNYQTSNIFTNIQRGVHKIFVKDDANCEIIEKEFLVINLINVITPNNDGLNDFLDYSDLNIKKDVSISIYDRFGSQVFKSQNQQFIWDGKLNGRALPTGNYWYILNWTEPDTNLPVSYKGWIVLKNRN